MSPSSQSDSRGVCVRDDRERVKGQSTGTLVSRKPLVGQCHIRRAVRRHRRPVVWSISGTQAAGLTAGFEVQISPRCKYGWRARRQWAKARHCVVNLVSPKITGALSTVHPRPGRNRPVLWCFTPFAPFPGETRRMHDPVFLLYLYNTSCPPVFRVKLKAFHRVDMQTLDWQPKD